MNLILEYIVEQHSLVQVLRTYRNLRHHQLLYKQYQDLVITRSLFKKSYLIKFSNKVNKLKCTKSIRINKNYTMTVAIIFHYCIKWL